MRAAGGMNKPQQSAAELLTERDRLLKEIEFLKEKISSKTIVSPANGIIDWKEDLQGAFVREGEVLGTIQQDKQQLVTVDIPLTDWIDLQPGDKALFILDTTFRRLPGEIRHISPTPISMQSGPAYRIKVAVNTAIPAGTAGTVTLKGKRINLLWYLCRTPFSYALAALGV